MVLTVGCAISVLAQTETPLPSTVVRLKGHARWKTEGGATWSMIKAGELINPGSVIETALGSDMDLLLGEAIKPARGIAAKTDLYNPENYPGNVVRLANDSALRIEKLTRRPAEGSKEPVEEILLELRSGTILGSVRKLGNESKYEITFAGGVVGMKDTVYGLSAKGELSVLKGAACIALENGQPASVVAVGQQFNPATGLITKLAQPASSSRGDLRPRSELNRQRTEVLPPILPRPRPPAGISPP